MREKIKGKQIDVSNFISNSKDEWMKFTRKLCGKALREKPEKLAYNQRKFSEKSNSPWTWPKFHGLRKKTKRERREFKLKIKRPNKIKHTFYTLRENYSSYHSPQPGIEVARCVSMGKFPSLVSHFNDFAAHVVKNVLKNIMLKKFTLQCTKSMLQSSFQPSVLLPVFLFGM